MNIRKSAGFAVAGLAAGILAVTTLTTTQASANDELGAERQTPRCLDGRQVGRTHVVDQGTLLIYDRFENPYLMKVSGPCRSMNDMSVFGFEFNGNTDICRAHDATLLRQDYPGGSVSRCIINDIKPLTRVEAAELDRDE